MLRRTDGRTGGIGVTRGGTALKCIGRQKKQQKPAKVKHGPLIHHRQNFNLKLNKVFWLFSTENYAKQ